MAATIHRRIARARWFLTAVAVIFLPAFAIPLFVAPLTWAEWFGWDIPPDSHLAEYFGRCLGAVAIAIAAQSLRGWMDPQSYRHLFELMGVAAALLAVTHLRGVFEGEQPLVEDLETLAYAAFAALAFWSRPPARAR